MKKYLLIISIIFSSCESKIEFYHGYVFDKNNKPIQNVKVREFSENNFYTYTDRLGYFKLKKNPNFSSDLIFTKNLYKSDTIKTTLLRYDGNKLLFMNDELDTLILRKITLSKNGSYEKH